MTADLARTLGRAERPLSTEIVRPITAADIASLEVERGITAPPLKRLRDSHHTVARLLAQGQTSTEIGEVTGYSLSRISILQGDPTFRDLVAHYRSRVTEIRDEVFSSGQAKLTSLRDDLIEEFHIRLQDNPEMVDNATILDGIKVTSDRTGLGPATKSTNVNVNLDLAGRIAAGRARVLALTAAVEPVLAGSGAEGDPGASPGPPPLLPCAERIPPSGAE